MINSKNNLENKPTFSRAAAPMWVRIQGQKRNVLGLVCRSTHEIFLNQMLVSSINTDTPGIMFRQPSGHPLSPCSWHPIKPHLILRPIITSFIPKSLLKHCFFLLSFPFACFSFCSLWLFPAKCKVNECKDCCFAWWHIQDLERIAGT